MKTKYGNATIDKHGYYVITSRKENNHGKKLHRLVFEDYHNCKLDENDVIHHADFDKTNNHPSNLICMSKKAHALLHKKGFVHSDDTKMKISESMSGENHPNYGKTGYWAGKKRPDISERMSGENHWNYGKHHPEETKNKISRSNKGKIVSEETKMKLSVANNTSGYFRVIKCKNKKYKQGFTWKYTYYENGKPKVISSVDIEKLEKKVKSKGLIWKKF